MKKVELEKQIAELKKQIAELEEKLAELKQKHEKLFRRHDMLFEKDYNLVKAIERALMEYKRNNAVTGSIIK